MLTHFNGSKVSLFQFLCCLLNPPFYFTVVMFSSSIRSSSISARPKTHQRFWLQRCHCSEVFPAHPHRSSQRRPSLHPILEGPWALWAPGPRLLTHGCRPDPPPAPALCESGSWSLSDAGHCISET